MSDSELDIESMRIAFDVMTGPAMMAFALESGAAVTATGHPVLGAVTSVVFYFAEREVSNMIKELF